MPRATPQRPRFRAATRTNRARRLVWRACPRAERCHSDGAPPSGTGDDDAARPQCWESRLDTVHRRFWRTDPSSYDVTVTELRVVVPDEIAEGLAAEARERGASAEDVAAEVLKLHVSTKSRFLPSWVGAIHSGRGDLSERHEEILKQELGTTG